MHLQSLTACDYAVTVLWKADMFERKKFKIFSASFSCCFGIIMMFLRCRNGRTAFNAIILPFRCLLFRLGKLLSIISYCFLLVCVLIN